METTTTTNPVTFTQSAINEITRLINEPGFDTAKKLRVGVKGGGCSGMTYVLEFDEQKPNDEVLEVGNIPFLMDKAHGMYLTGMEINWEGGLNARGFT